MTNEVAVRADVAPQPVITYVGSEMIAATARALTDAHTIGSALCRTAFVPKHFQGKPDDAAAAILYGASIDMDPITALQNIFVIGGKPALYARTMVAIVMSKGHRVWTESESEGSVTVCGQRKGSETVERVTWTTEMAKRAGYDSNAKYRTDPRSMLYARASGDVARRIAPDALLGMAHNVEEMQLEPATAERDAPITLTAFTAQETPTAQADTPAPSSLDEFTDAGHVPITAPQMKKLHALLNEAGLSDRDEGLAYLSERLGREVETSKSLSKDEAGRVIDALETFTQPALDEEPQP